MSQVLDYSAGFPGALAIAKPRDAQGRQVYVGAARYIGFPERKKCTTRAELEDFSRNGLGMALIYEDTATDWRSGYDRGLSAGKRARDHANSIGFPAGRPIYMAVDQDVVSSGEFNVMLDYLRGASGPLGGTHLTGAYGEADVIDRVRNEGVAAWYWQTVAWSHGRRTYAHLFQHLGTVNVGGIGCDINDVLVSDWGQHNALEDDVSWNDPIEFTNPDTGEVTRFTAAQRVAWTNYYAGRIAVQLDALAGTLSDDEANIIAAMRQPVDAVQFAALVAPLLGPLVQAGASEEQVRAAVDEGIRQAFARAGQPEGTTP